VNNIVPTLSQQRSWICRLDDRLVVSLVAYRGAEQHHAHRHECAQLTIQLAGALEEKIESREYHAQGAMVGFKPEGALHADRWGNSGALLFTISAGTEHGRSLFRDFDAGWARIDTLAEIIRHIRWLPEASAEEVFDALPDIAALCSPRPDTVGSAPPRWLLNIHEALCDDPAGNPIATVAQAESVHRVHLARSFRRHFGITPSQFRNSQMAARLVNCLSEPGMTLAECALQSGFCDQSHGARALRRNTGFSLAQMRALLGSRHVTSIQDRSALAH